MNWEYIAGFFDGEGCVSHLKNQWRISVGQNTKEVLQEIRDYIGYGTIYKEYSTQYTQGVHYRLQIFRKKEVYAFLSTILPYVIVKKERVMYALTYFPTGETI